MSSVINLEGILYPTRLISSISGIDAWTGDLFQVVYVDSSLHSFLIILAELSNQKRINLNTFYRL